MIDFFLLSLPIFGIVAAGWAAASLGWVPAGTIDILGTFSVRFALPALIARLISLNPCLWPSTRAFTLGTCFVGSVFFVWCFSYRVLLTKTPVSQRRTPPPPR